MIATTPASQELGLIPIQKIPIGDIWPSLENDQLYRPVDENDPEIEGLARSIAELGIQEPLIVTKDYVIISGNRRFKAALLVGLSHLPCRVLDFDQDDDPDRFMRLLRECNRQRVKTFDESVREAAMDIDTEGAYQSLIEHRREASTVTTGDNVIKLLGKKTRSKISAAKMPFLNAVVAIIMSIKAFWPLSVRQLHYLLLNAPPLKHASKPGSVYCNDKASYKALSDLLARARTEGIISWEVIADKTRPVTS